jgi:hypothetical protein
MFRYSLMEIVFIKVFINLLLLLSSQLALFCTLDILSKLLFIQFQGFLTRGPTVSSFHAAHSQCKESQCENAQNHRYCCAKTMIAVIELVCHEFVLNIMI